jgi:DNA repair exonuclease SbcCD nuclease subunit
MIVANSQGQLNFLLALLLLLFLVLGTPGSGIGASFQKQPALWKFAVISDTQGDNREKNNKSCINNTVLQTIVEDIVRENPDFVLVAGDLVNGWFRNGETDYAIQYANWKEAMKSVYQAGIQVYPVRGNHDSGPERVALPPLPSHLEPPADALIRLKEAFRKSFPESYIPKNGPAEEKGLTYSFTHKNAFIIGLDQYSGSEHKVNQDWLNSQLGANKSLHVFVYGHEPAFDKDHKDNLAFYPKERDTFWNSIGRAGGHIYFCGHEHLYSRAMVSDSSGNRIHQIVAGTGGGVLRASGIIKDNKRVEEEYSNGNHHGYILVTVEGPRVTIVWRAMVQENSIITWSVLDSFSYSSNERPDQKTPYERQEKKRRNRLQSHFLRLPDISKRS